jgi:hypothetical protein
VLRSRFLNEWLSRCIKACTCCNCIVSVTWLWHTSHLLLIRYSHWHSHLIARVERLWNPAAGCASTTYISIWIIHIHLLLLVMTHRWHLHLRITPHLWPHLLLWLKLHLSRIANIRRRHSLLMLIWRWLECLLHRLWHWLSKLIH